MSRRKFEVEIKLNGHTLEVRGWAEDPVPAKVSGPPDSWCPAEGGELEDLEIRLVRKRKHGAKPGSGMYDYRELCPAVAGAQDVEDAVWERLAEDGICE